MAILFATRCVRCDGDGDAGMAFGMGSMVLGRHFFLRFWKGGERGLIGEGVGEGVVFRGFASCRFVSLEGLRL